jgi:acyl-CoA synthetase (NDP forming)/GNAT superfamily N-acetyltransferase
MEMEKERQTALPSGSVLDVLLADGRIATIRPVAEEDRAELIALHDRIGDENVRLRFFSLNRAAAHSYAERLCQPSDPEGRIALTGWVGDQLVAVASAEPIEPGSAEVSFLVADSAHGLGLGTLLLEHLAAAARDRHIGRLTAEVLTDNFAMLRVLADAGFDLDRHADLGVITLRMDTAATARAVAAADARESRAEARSLAPLLYPRSVAVVGVRRDGAGVGRAVVDAIRKGGFAGDVYAVHPAAAQRTGSELAGIPAYASLTAIGKPVDLVVVAVPARQVLDVIGDASTAGAKSAVVLSSGFGELGPEGADLQRRIVTLARKHSLRLVGPNCLGVIANDPAVQLNATFTGQLPPPGRLAVASQSGGVGIAVIDLARESGLGIGSFVSLGNKADVSGNDLLAAWLDDDRVGAAALYLESFGNARKFARIARRFAERKPLLAIVGGRSDGGARAGASHTAAAATPGVGVDALFAQAGVIGCPGLTALTDTARLLADQSLPAGARLAVVGNAGGLGVLAADAASAAGAAVPQLSLTLRERLARIAAGAPAVDNPIDLGAAASGVALRDATTALLESDEVDAVLLVIAGTTAADPGACLPEVAARTDRSNDGQGKPLLLVAVGEVDVPAPAKPAWTRFRAVEDATGAFARVAGYAAWRSAPGDSQPSAQPLRQTSVAAVARDLAAGALTDSTDSGGSGWLGFASASGLLGCYGIDLLGQTAFGADAAVAVATRTGYPVAVKAADPGVGHKTDRGLVRTGLGSAEEVHRTVDAFSRELGRRDPLVLIQPQVPAGVEVAVGLVRDPSIGPLVMVAAGGVATDVWDDRTFLMAPLTNADAARAVRSLRIWPLLAGHRGSPPVDVVALERLIVAVGQLADDVPTVAELDLNPVIVSPAGAICVDARVRLSEPVGPRDAGIPRQLRPVH